MNIVGETAEDTYISTGLSNAFTESRFRDGIIYTYVSSIMKDICEYPLDSF